MRVELAGEDFVGVGRFQQFVTNLLNFGHSCFIVELDVGLRASHAELFVVVRTVNCVKTVFFVEAEVLNRVSVICSPAYN